MTIIVMLILISSSLSLSIVVIVVVVVVVAVVVVVVVAVMCLSMRFDGAREWRREGDGTGRRRDGHSDYIINVCVEKKKKTMKTIKQESDKNNKTKTHTMVYSIV